MSNRVLRTILMTIALVAIASLSLAACGDDDNGPITSLSDASERDGDAELEGFVHIADGRARLCGTLRESFPPQCGDPWVEIANRDALDIELVTEQSVSWTDAAVSLTGTVQEGVLTIGS